MVFDRNAINKGRIVLDFGLADLKGTYYNTSKLRAKGWLAVLFFAPGDPNSAQALATLGQWTSDLPANKVSVVGVATGDRTELAEFATANNVTFPVLWDYDEYVMTIWSITAVPTLIVTDSAGKVLARIAGTSDAQYADVKSLVEEGIKKAEEAAKAAAEAKAAADAAKAAEASKAQQQPAAVKN